MPDVPSLSLGVCTLRHVLLVLVLLVSLVCSGCASRVASTAASADHVVTDTSEVNSKNRFVRALLLVEKGDLWRAEKLLRTVRSSNPSSMAAVHSALSKTLFGLGFVDSAKVHAEKSVFLDPDNRQYIRMLASIAHHVQDLPRAIALCSRLVELEPTNTDYLAMLAFEYMSAGEPEKALAVFKRMLALDPSNRQTRDKVILLEVKLKRYREAIGTLIGHIGKGEKEDSLMLTLGALYDETGQRKLAEKTFRELVAANPHFVPAWLAVLDLSVKSGDRRVFAGDLKAFYDATALTPEQKTTLAELFYSRTLKDSSAVNFLHDMLTEIERRHPGEPATAILRGQLKLREKKTSDAVREFQRVLARNPSNVEAWEGLVSAYLSRKEYARVAGAVARAKTQVRAGRFRLLVLEGYAAFQAGRIRKAVTLLEKALNRKQLKKERWSYLQGASILAMGYDKLGLNDKSMVMYRRILLLDPGNTLAMNNYAYLLSLQGRDLEMAKKLALAAVSDEPDNPVYLDTLGWVLFRLGEYSSALSYLEKAALLAPDEEEIATHLLHVYEKTGKQEKADRLRERIERLKGAGADKSGR